MGWGWNWPQVLRPAMQSGIVRPEDQAVGYDIHITRTDEWFESEASPIGVEQCMAVIEQDPDLRLAGDSAFDSGLYFEWTGHPHRIESFELSGGRISIKNPDNPTLAKMLDLAERLQAKVVGDDGESYDRQSLERSRSKRPRESRLAKQRERLSLKEKEALSYGVFFPAHEVDGIRIRPVEIAVHTDELGCSYWIVFRRTGEPPDVEMVDLESLSTVEQWRFLFIPVGFRLSTQGGRQFSILVGQSRNWIRRLASPKDPVSFVLSPGRRGWKWVWQNDRQ